MKANKEKAGYGTCAEQMRSELKRIRYKRAYWRTLRSTLGSLLVIVAFVLLIAAYLPVIRMTGDSMADTLRRGDVLLTLRGDEVKRGDLIVFYVEGNKMLVKRVAALGGDQVQLEQDGTLAINGQIIDEKYISNKSLGEGDLEFPFEVPEGRVFVLGDNRELSVDSRSSAMRWLSGTDGVPPPKYTVSFPSASTSGLEPVASLITEPISSVSLIAAL